MRRVPGVCLVAVLSTTLPVVAVGQTSGQPAMYATSSTYYSSSQYQDAHLSDSGNDMSQAINATWAKCTASTGVAGPVACAIKAGYTGYQVWTVNPFGNDTFNGGDVDLCAAGVTDIRVGGPSVAAYSHSLCCPAACTSTAVAGQALSKRTTTTGIPLSAPATPHFSRLAPRSMFRARQSLPHPVPLAYALSLQPTPWRSAKMYSSTTARIQTR